MERPVEDESQRGDINETEPTPENESTNESSYSTLTHEYEHPVICKSLKGDEERRLNPVEDDGCEKVILALLEDAYKRTNGNVYISVFKVIEQAAVEAFFTEGPEELLDGKM